MADKSIAELPESRQVADDTLIPVWQPGAANEAQSMTGQQFREFAEASVKPYSDSAVQAALTAAGCETGAQQAWTGVQNAIKNIPAGSTPIVNDLTTGGAKMALSAEMGKVLGRRPNPNLLDNWYFGDPINQRGGYFAPTGTPWWLSSDLSGASGGVALSPRKIVEKTAAYCRWEYNGVSYYCKPDTVIRGYFGIGYTIDRWYNIGNTIEIESDGILVTNTATYVSAFRQIFPIRDFLGKKVTASVLASGNVSLQIATGTGVNTNYAHLAYTPGEASTGVSSVTATVPKDTTNTYLIVSISIPVECSARVQAVKLELGNVQTLAHLDSTGAWVLNEIPDKAQVLLQCIQSTADPSDACANKVIHHTGNKPRGSYTGNGSSASRTVVVTDADFSNGLLIFSNNGGALVAKTSSVLWSSVRGVVGVTYDEVHFTGTELVIASDNPNLNAAGVTYYYQVL